MTRTLLFKRETYTNCSNNSYYNVYVLSAVENEREPKQILVTVLQVRLCEEI